jgi:GTPase SAR1 family protein
MFVNKEISVFPKPYNYTPYNKFNFKTAIHGNCASFVCSLKVCKIIILGDVCVGKTSVLNRFCYKIFDNTYRSTIGVDFQCEEINILGIPYHLQIWDTAGQERFKCITQCYYRKAHGEKTLIDMYMPMKRHFF